MPKTSKQVLAEQQKQADHDRAQALAAPKPALPAALDQRSTRQKYLDDIAPSGIVGRLIKFNGKDGKFVFADDDEVVSGDEDFVALCDQTLVSWVKFQQGQPPIRIGGLLYQGFALPLRDQLDESNPAKWPIGLSGQPEDPWKHEMLLVLRRPKTLELLTFSTMSKTGRRSVGGLLKHYERLAPGSFPVVRLKPGGFRHPDTRIDWVAVPNFVVVGVAAGHAPDAPDTSLKAQMDDEVPF